MLARSPRHSPRSSGRCPRRRGSRGIPPPQFPTRTGSAPRSTKVSVFRDVLFLRRRVDIKNTRVLRWDAKRSTRGLCPETRCTEADTPVRSIPRRFENNRRQGAQPRSASCRTVPPACQCLLCCCEADLQAVRARVVLAVVGDEARLELEQVAPRREIQAWGCGAMLCLELEVQRGAC